MLAKNRKFKIGSATFHVISCNKGSCQVILEYKASSLPENTKAGLLRPRDGDVRGGRQLPAAGRAPARAGSDRVSGRVGRAPGHQDSAVRRHLSHSDRGPHAHGRRG